jgi:Lipopolysaccharide-assembly
MRYRFQPVHVSSRIALLSIVLMSALVQSGCGYRPMVSGRASDNTSDTADVDAKRGDASTRLAVMAIRNDSPEPWLDRIMTDALRREMDARGGLFLVNDPNDADLVLRGRVLPLLVQSRSFSSFVAALEYSVTLALDLHVVRASGEVIRLDPTLLRETEIYLASADIETTRTHKQEALRRLSDLLASRIADSIELMQRPTDEIASDEDPQEGA